MRFTEKKLTEEAYRKWRMGNGIVALPMTSRYYERSRSWLQSA